MDEFSEQNLVIKAKTDEHAFGLLFERYYPPIFNYILRRVQDIALAQDLAAETFYKALTKRNLFIWRGVSFGAWLYRIALNEIKMHARRQAFLSLDQLMEETGFDVPSCVNLAEEVLEAERILERSADMRQLALSIKQLPLKYQEVVSLKYLADKKTAEIAEILGKREGTIKSLLSRGIEKLRQSMQPFKPPGIILAEELIHP